MIPKGVLRDIVTSNLPGFTGMPLVDHRAPDRRVHDDVLADRSSRSRRAAGHSHPEPEGQGVEGVIFVTAGELTLTLAGFAARPLGRGLRVPRPRGGVVAAQ